MPISKLSFVQFLVPWLVVWFLTYLLQDCEYSAFKRPANVEGSAGTVREMVVLASLKFTG